MGHKKKAAIAAFFYACCAVLVNPVADAEGHAIAEAIVGAGGIHQEVIQRTAINRQLNWHILRHPFGTTLNTGCETKTMVSAVSEIDGGTNEPVEVASDGEYPMIGNCQIDVIVGVAAETEVKFQTVCGCYVMLVGEFCTITGSMCRTDTAEAATDVLCVGSKGQAQDCNQNKQ